VIKPWRASEPIRAKRQICYLFISLHNGAPSLPCADYICNRMVFSLLTSIASAPDSEKLIGKTLCAVGCNDTLGEMRRLAISVPSLETAISVYRVLELDNSRVHPGDRIKSGQ